ncbi:MAG: preprotein translocase subunit SecE [Candidatus Levybacteria bacterium RIFCSPHIGHO2_01_FULL_40_15b]|nr:MAG: preprotein translocase subunit SecE [Candidatus Levybacteria bacterium RIFCSPHIGHO2_01_FULL_40_15b]
MFRFLGEVKSELDKVTWPDLNNVVRLTSIVIIISLLVGVYLGAADFLFTNLLGILVR